jgi:hypothetical protein
MIPKSIKLLSASIMAAVSSAVCFAGDSDVPLNRYSSLKQLAAKVTANSMPQEVRLVLGDPVRDETGGWGHLERKVWSYVDYTDESQSVSFSMTFDPKAGCSVAASRALRSDVMKNPRKVVVGTVRAVYRDYPTEGGNGFLCVCISIMGL